MGLPAFAPPNPIAQLKEEMPEVYKDLEAVRIKLENHFKGMQDFEFTVKKMEHFTCFRPVTANAPTWLQYVSRPNNLRRN